MKKNIELSPTKSETNDGKSSSFETKVEEPLVQQSNNGGASAFLQKFQIVSFRAKFLYSVALLFICMVMGWNKGQSGPTLLDLILLTNVGLDQGSGFRTAYYIGVVIGCVALAIVYGKIFAPFLMSALLGVAAVLMALIPWCWLYPLMVAAHLVLGCCGGSVEALAYAEVVVVWTNESKSFMMLSQFAFALATIIAPLVTSPFLSRMHSSRISTSDEDVSAANLQMNMTRISKNNSSAIVYSLLNGAVNTTQQRSPINPESKVFIAYSITAVFILCTAMFLFTIGSKYKKFLTRLRQTSRARRETGNNSIKKILSLLIICSLMAMYNATDYTFCDFLTVFTVKHMGWMPSEGAVITSVVFIASLIGRFFGIFVVRIFKLANILGVCFLLLLVSNIGLIVTAHERSDAGLWVCSVLFGVAISITFGCIISWTDECFVQVNGKISSLLLLSGFGGAVFNPMILSRLMLRSTMWFPFVFTIESAVCFLLFLIAYFYSRFVLKTYCETLNGELTKEISEDIRQEGKM